jgi:hypothetical protein
LTAPRRNDDDPRDHAIIPCGSGYVSPGTLRSAYLWCSVATPGVVSRAQNVPGWVPVKVYISQPWYS